MIGYFGGWLALLVANTPVAFSLGIMGVAWLMFEGGSLATAPQRLIGGIDSFPLLAVPLFILSGLLMNASGVSDRIYNFAKVLVGHFAGGLGHVNVVGSLIFSGMSGILNLLSPIRLSTCLMASSMRVLGWTVKLSVMKCGSSPKHSLPLHSTSTSAPRRVN